MPEMRQTLFNGRSLGEAQECDSCFEGSKEEGCQEESRQEESQAEEKSPKRPRCQASRSSPGCRRSVQTSRFDAGRARPADHRCSCYGTTEDGRVGESPEIISGKSNSHNACMDVGRGLSLPTRMSGPLLRLLLVNRNPRLFQQAPPGTLRPPVRTVHARPLLGRCSLRSADKKNKQRPHRLVDPLSPGCRRLFLQRPGSRS